VSDRRRKSTLTRVKTEAARLVAAISAKSAGAPNETSLVHEIETELERTCKLLSIPWTPFRLDLTLSTDDPRKKRYADVAHGAVLIEYEPPFSFSGIEGAKLRYAQAQSSKYALLLAAEEGRQRSEYILGAWDGSHISFGRYHSASTTAKSERLSPFNSIVAERLIEYLRSSGVPLVHPLLLASLIGPESEYGTILIPKFFRALRKASSSSKTTKTKLLFTEWKRLFGQVVGIQSLQLKKFLKSQSQAHDEFYGDDTAAYLFALNTFIALVAKLVAALSLPNISEDLRDANVRIEERIKSLESGLLFSGAGISNMLSGDFEAYPLSRTPREGT
jgi:hypothetical protein